jgi:hypothetical protein
MNGERIGRAGSALCVVMAKLCASAHERGALGGGAALTQKLPFRNNPQHNFGHNVFEMSLLRIGRA